MDNLIYFHLDKMVSYDPELRSDNYRHRHWFGTLGVDLFPVILQSRVHKIDTPWNLAPTVCPIPSLPSTNLDFGQCMDQTADDLCNVISTTNRRPVLCWSGGIDSTSILVSLLKNGNKALIDNLLILYDPVLSVGENAYFFYKFIKNRIQIADINDFVIDTNNYNKIILLDGEGGNQCTTSTPIHKLAYRQEFDLLYSPWKSTKPEQFIAIETSKYKTTKESLYFAMDLVKESIAYSPIPIETVYDFLWWLNFNLKFDDVLLKKIPVYGVNLNQSELADFWNNSLYHFYATDIVQQWSMVSLPYRSEKTKIDAKYHVKKYIFDFDKNDIYFANKQEEKSNSRSYVKNPVDIVAIDSNWKRYSLIDKDTRNKLGKILERV